MNRNLPPLISTCRRHNLGLIFSALVLAVSVLAASVLTGCSSSTTTTGPTSSAYVITNLIANNLSYGNLKADNNLKNAWGIALSTTNKFWIASNHGNAVVAYDSAGTALTPTVRLPQSDTSKTISPTGIALNSGNAYFRVPGHTAARFLVASEEGMIDAVVDTPAIAVNIIDHSSAGANYKGIAIGTYMSSGTLVPAIYAANFANGNLDVFDVTFGYKTSFTPPATLPGRYAPFNVRNINGTLYVLFARQKGDGDDSAGVGYGYVAKFDMTTGNYLTGFFINGGVSGADTSKLNAPWGLAIAPDNFGDFSGKLLIANFGDGKISAYDKVTGLYFGQLKDAADKEVVIPGLWDIATNPAASTSAIFFTAGPNGENDGVFGMLSLKK